MNTRQLVQQVIMLCISKQSKWLDYVFTSFTCSHLLFFLFLFSFSFLSFSFFVVYSVSNILKGCQKRGLQEPFPPAILQHPAGLLAKFLLEFRFLTFQWPLFLSVFRAIPLFSIPWTFRLIQALGHQKCS